MKIFCDVDGVVADLHTPWLKRYSERSGNQLVQENVTSFHISEFVPPEWKQPLFDILREPDLYLEVQPIPDALAAIKALRASQHRVVFTTSCVKGMADQKWEWLETHEFLPRRYSHKDFVTLTDKSLLFGDLIIDDKFEHCEDFIPMSILFDQPWNRGESLLGMDKSHIRRAKGWQEVITLIGGAPWL